MNFPEVSISIWKYWNPSKFTRMMQGSLDMSASTTAGRMRQSKAIDLNDDDDDPNNLNRYKLGLFEMMSLFCPNSRHPEGVKSQNLTLRTHTAMIKTSSDHQTTIKPLLDYLSHFGLFSFLCPIFSSRRLATYFTLPRQTRSLGNRHNTTAWLSTQ